MKRTNSGYVVLPLVLALVFAGAGCNRGHRDRLPDVSQGEGPDQLPLRLQLPKDSSPEAVRILQYAQDNVTRKVQQSILKQGPYSGGRQLRIYDDNNILNQIRTYYAASTGSPEQLGYVATFSHGLYLTERSFTSDGTRQTEGQRLPDGTFEQNTFYADGNIMFKHAIFGRLMSDKQKLQWKLFSDNVYRQDNSVGAIQQLMDDGGMFSRFLDEHNFLTETLFVDKSGKPICETDYAKDGKTPVVRYDFGDKTIWTFDNKGQIASKRKWFFDNSQQLTVYKAGAPVYMQDWEVDHPKSDKNATLVLYLSWVKELRQDGSVVREIHYLTGTKTVETIDVSEAPPKDAKLKPAEGLPTLGSTTPAKNWTPPPAAAKPATTATPAAAPTTKPAASPYWTPSGAHVKYTYSKKGYLIEVETYKAEYESDKTVAHKESEQIRPRVNPQLTKPLPPGNPPPDKAKDPTPTLPVPFFDFDFD